MGSQIAGGQYLDLTEAGVSNDRARAAASLNAVAQSALEKVGLGKVMGAGARAAKIATMGGKTKEVFKTALRNTRMLLLKYGLKMRIFPLKSKYLNFIRNLEKSLKEALIPVLLVRCLVVLEVR